MPTHTIAFIGGGNMARSLIGGLMADGWSASHIRVADPNAEQLAALEEHFGVVAQANNLDAIAGADVVLLAVKPNMIRQAIGQISDATNSSRPLVLSIAAGVLEHDIRRWFGCDLPIVRTMPNTPALVRSGATALYANQYTNSDQRDLAESIMRAVGLVIWVEEESLLDAVTAVSGSGPAYFFMLMESLEKAAVDMGLSAESARLLAVQTAFGTSKLALESNEDPSTLRRRVTSPGGTTEAAIRVLQGGQLDELVALAVKAAKQRSEELGSAFGAEE